MEWQQILGFYHTARLGSFTRAAEVTFRTQSALSQQIKSLEEELGCRLFDRTGARKIRLTVAGRRFLEFAESALRGFESVTADLNEMKGVSKGPLKVAAPFTTLYHLLPEKLKEYAGVYPLVELTLLDRPQGSVIRLVRGGEVDFGLVLESLVTGDLDSVRWKRVETVLMVPPDHPLTAAKRVTWKQIAQFPLILPPPEMKYSGRSVLEKQFQKPGQTYRVVMESSNVELSSVYVEMGLGISLATIVRDLPALSARSLEFISLDHYFKPDHICLVTRKGSKPAPYKLDFAAMLLGAVPPVFSN